MKNRSCAHRWSSRTSSSGAPGMPGEMRKARVESQFRFRRHPHGPQLEVHVAPVQEHHFLLAETGQQKRGEQGTFQIGASGKEAGKLFMAVYLHERRNALR